MARWLSVTGVPTSLEAWRAMTLQEQVDLRTIRQIESDHARTASTAVRLEEV